MKKFSKLASLALAGAMAFSLVACSGDNGSTGTTTEKTETTVTEDTTEVTTETTETTEDTADLGLKAGFICLHDENSTYDLNFISAAKAACQDLGVECIIKTNIPEGQECQQAAEELADAGCDFIFADSFGHEDYTKPLRSSHDIGRVNRFVGGDQNEAFAAVNHCRICGFISTDGIILDSLTRAVLHKRNVLMCCRMVYDIGTVLLEHLEHLSGVTNGTD